MHRRRTTIAEPAPLMDVLEPRLACDAAGASMSTAMRIDHGGAERPILFIGESISAGDTDLFRLDISQRRDVGFIVTGGSSMATLAPLTADLNIELFNAQGTQIAASRRVGTRTDSILIDLPAGTYYARVLAAAGATGVTAYQLVFAMTPSIGRAQINTATGAVAHGTYFGPALDGGVVVAPAPITPPAAPAPPAGAAPASPAPPSMAVPGQSALSAVAILGRLSRSAIVTTVALSPSSAERTYGYQLAGGAKVRFDVGNVTGRSVIVQIVDSTGRLIKQSEVGVNRTLRYDVRLTAGNYYVRVLSPDAAAAGARISVMTI